ncbi:response regulator [Pseudoalteromonas sp. K222D]|uniref:response regulator n=1 Tax=Pseudoalteromonas sp. K222D TaxID=2820756 RepID=UPI001AD63BDD|nr:response regulator [Pseudoalteromonas sp. K222D]MBO7927974.1 response regulator [Pseudoalteromonas sp. K222D]
MKILLVEDEASCIDDFESTLKRYNHQNNKCIQYEVAKNVEEANSMLNSSFDGAIVDLKLESKVTGGNEVIRNIQDNFRIPIVVFTGTPSNLDQEENPLLGLYLRDRGYDDVLNFLVKIYNTGLTQILGGRGLFEKAMNEVFWTNIPQAIEHFQKDCNPETSQVQLLRFTLAHMYEHIDLDFNTNSNSAETYIYPGSKKLQGGSIVRSKMQQNLYILLTPACDLAQCKADYLQLAQIKEIREIPEIIDILPADGEELSNNRSNKINNKIQNFVRNKAARYHYLPMFGAVENDSVVDFQNIHSIEESKFLEHYELLGSVSNYFYKDLLSRFSALYSRQGSPDYDFIDEEKKLFLKLTNTIT